MDRKPKLSLTVAVFVAAMLAGCGGSSNGETAENATRSRDDAQADAKAAQAAVQRSNPTPTPNIAKLQQETDAYRDLSSSLALNRVMPASAQAG